MNRERFIRQRRADWQKFESLLGRLTQLRGSRWQTQDIAELSRLYRSLCYDLSLVQSRDWGARLEQYLNDLVAQGHNCLYRSPPRSLAGVIDFLRSGFPLLLRKRKWHFVLALALFAGPLLTAALVGSLRPDLAELVAGPESVEAARTSFRNGLYDRVDEEFASQRSLMAGFYLRNNAGIAFQAFALGGFCGVGTVYVLLSNGISIGMVTGVMIADGGSTARNFFSFVIAHSAFELTAIVIAGSAGLVLGQGMLIPGQRTRAAALLHHGTEALLLALGAGTMLFVAALIEAYCSPLPIAPEAKYAVGGLMWILVILYLSMGGRESAAADRVAG